MSKSMKIVFALIVVTTVILVACQPSAPAETGAGGDKTKVAVVFPGVVTDQSWNQFGYEGLVTRKRIVVSRRLHGIGYPG
jgi:basic membrane lipoprotein Med (substrate-binding protein (PBP1-ABC) superfamily)